MARKERIGSGRIVRASPRWAVAVALGLALGLSTTSAAPEASGASASASTSASTTGGAKGSTFELPREKAERVWDAEHITFKLETYVNKPLMAAWKKRDRAKIAGFFHEDATFQVPASQPALSARDTRPIQDRSWSEAPLKSASRADGLAAFFPPSDFASFKKAKMRVLYLSRVGGSDLHWKVRFWHEAEGKRKDGKLVSLEAEYEAEIRFEDKAEIDAGRVIAAWAPAKQLLRVGVGPLFEEITESSGLGALPLADNWKLAEPGEAQQYRFQVAVEDFDGDGYPDIAIATVKGAVYLMRSERGQRFVDVSSQVGLQQPGLPPGAPPFGDPSNSVVGWIDYDNDGDPDLVLGKRFYRNDEGKRFTNVSKEVGWKADAVPVGVNVADYDRDGNLDLYVMYQRRRSTRPARVNPWIGDNRSGARNELLLNKGGKFEDATVLWGAGGGDRQTFAAATFHMNDDLWPDLYLANDFAKNVVLQNIEGAEFVDVSETMGAGDYSTSMGVAAGDLTGDGTPEVYVANMYSKMGQRIIAQVDEQDYPDGVYSQLQGSAAGSRLYCSGAEGDGDFDELGQQKEVEAVGWAYAPALVDVDGDGWLDIYATTGFMSFDRSMPDG